MNFEVKETLHIGPSTELSQKFSVIGTPEYAVPVKILSLLCSIRNGMVRFVSSGSVGWGEGGCG